MAIVPNPSCTEDCSWQAVFFDFDGVIAASTEVKCRAFTQLFAPFGQAVQRAVVRYHLAHGGMPRQEKLRHCYAIIAGNPLDDQQLRDAGERFAATVFDGVVSAPLIDGVIPTLTWLEQHRCPAFVVSGTPHDEMNTIVRQRGLSPMFTEVHGSPQTKTVILADILSRYAFTPHRCLFIGDALADLQAASTTGLHFLGIVPNGAVSPFPHAVTTTPSVYLPPYPG